MRNQDCSSAPLAVFDCSRVTGKSQGEVRTVAGAQEIDRWDLQLRNAQPNLAELVSVLWKNLLSDAPVSVGTCEKVSFDSQSVVPQGSVYLDTNGDDLIGLLIGFSPRGDLPSREGVVEDYINKTGQLFVYLVALYTAASVAVARNAGRPIDMDDIVELILMNNTAMPMTLGTLIFFSLGFVSVLPTDDGMSTPDSAGKRALIAFAERSATFGADPSVIRAVHLSDKTGTLTENSMKLVSVLELAEPLRSLAPDDAFLLVRRLVAVTSLQPHMPSVVSLEEAEYARALGFSLRRIIPIGHGWERVEFDYGTTLHSITRLRLGLSRKHRAVFALLKLNDDTPALDAHEPIQVELVFQGAPSSAQGESGLLIDHADVPVPTSQQVAAALPQTCSQNLGAPRHWVVGWSKALQLRYTDLAGIEDRVDALQNWPENADNALAEAIALHTDSWVEGVPLSPKFILVLYDSWRNGAAATSKFLAERHTSFWLVSGDGLANLQEAAEALGLPRRRCFIRTEPLAQLSLTATCSLTRDEHAGLFWEALDQLSSEVLCEPRTLYLSPAQQRFLSSCDGIETERLNRVVRWLTSMCNGPDGTLHPAVQVVCWNSEPDLKGLLVRFVGKAMNVPTIFTGDGKNDIPALAEADCSVAFPGPDGVCDPEVAASATLLGRSEFWSSYTAGRIHTGGDVLRLRVALTGTLLILKQNITAGINLAAAHATGMRWLADPYTGLIYLMFQICAFATVALSGLTVDTPHARTPSLRLTSVLSTGLIGYALGLLSFAFASRWSGVTIPPVSDFEFERSAWEPTSELEHAVKLLSEIADYALFLEVVVLWLAVPLWSFGNLPRLMLEAGKVHRR
jgi:soluble P-type ATPase